MLLIYTDAITARLAYVCEFIFTRVIPCEYRLTNDAAECEHHQGAKLSYSKQLIGHAFHIEPVGLLFEEDVHPLAASAISGEEGFKLFPVKDGDTGFDVFAAAFFMTSRYEEWLPYEADRHGRFEAKNSILFKAGCLHLPVLDQWCHHLKSLLQKRFPQLVFRKKQYSYLSTIDVDNDYAYLGKPLYRNIGASVKDVLKGNFSQLKQRLAVLSGKQTDPFDAYQYQASLANETHPLLYFFLTIDRQTDYDRALPCRNPLFKQVIDQVKNTASAGIHPSYFSQDHDKLGTEKKQLEQWLGKPVTKSRQHYLHFDIKTTPQLLISGGIEEDHTMGFASHYGFRAGTCTPFKYFDLQKNEATELDMIPFCAMDSVFYDYLQKTPQQAEAIIELLVKEIKAVDGLFVTVWHDRSFSGLHFPGWKALYEKLQVN